MKLDRITKVESVKKDMGQSPAIALVNPKFARNLGAVIRAASCFNFNQVWFSGKRLTLDPTRQDRLPREERMKGYMNVEVYQCDRFFDAFENATPVAIELKPGAIPLQDFEMPTNPVFVYGPEDGSLERVHLQHCHHIVVLPTKHCLNLATAVSITLWEWTRQMHIRGEKEILPMDELLSSDRASLRDLITEDDEVSIG